MGADFEPGLTRLFRAISSCTSKGPCLDVGGNIGITALLLSGLYEHVYCFEASPRTHQILQQNLSSNQIDNVTALAFGLGSANQQLTLTSATNDASGGFISTSLAPPSIGHTQEIAELRRGDEAIAAIKENLSQKISFIKIDVEGSELDVLTGLEGLLKTAKPIVVMEMNHWCLNAFKRVAIPDFLEALDSRFPVLAAYDDCTQDILDISAHMTTHRYHVMHEHIVKNRYPTLIGLQDKSTLECIATRIRAQRENLTKE